jgi:cell wall-associated NlpC family hydrolase
MAFVVPAQGASPQADLAAKTAQAKALQAKIDANNNQADTLDEQLVQAQDAVAQANSQIATTERGIASAQANTARLRVELGGRAATLYMGAGNVDPFQIDATDVRELGSRAQYSAAAAQQDQNLLDQLRISQEQLGIQEKTLVAQKSQAQTHQSTVEAAQKDLQDLTRQQQQLLGQVKGQMATLVKQVQQEQAAAAQAAARARVQRFSNSGGGTGGGDTGIAPGPLPAPSGGAAAAIAYAQAQLGKPYIYAGTGPAGYDCSGLTMMAWAAGGVAMAHGSQSQYDSFPKVPISQLQPGDLVFFGVSGPANHHVGLYVGGGTMIEAPHTGAFVRYSSIYRPDLVPLGSRP